LSTKIHATVDALGNPTGFHLTGGQEHDLAGADALLPELEAETLIADKAFDADQRVLEPLAEAGKVAVIPPRQSRKAPRAFDKDSTIGRTGGGSAFFASLTRRRLFPWEDVSSR
jgi:transposase